MINWGAVPLGRNLPFIFDSYAGSTGASITMTGIAVADINVYKDVSMTQRASTAGFALLDTDGIDIDGFTGIHGFSIDTNDNTDAGFFAAGSCYTVVVSSVTIDAQTVSFVAGTFFLTATPTVLGVPEVDVTHWIGTAAATPTTAGVPEVDLTFIAGAAVSTTTAQLGVNAVQAAGTAWNSGAIGAGTIAAGAITATKFAAGALDAVWSTAARLLTAGTNIVLAKGTGVTGFNDLSATDIHAELVTALNVDAYAEVTGVPAASTPLSAKIGFVYEALRNKVTVTSTTMTFFDNSAVAQWTKALSDDGTTYTEAEGA